MPGEPQATIRGIPQMPSITEVNVRPSPSTQFGPSFTAPVGLAGLAIQEVQPDETGAEMNGKRYQWFRLLFSSGAQGWVRDDLLTVSGDLRPFGYPDLDALIFAFDLVREGFGEPTTPPTQPEAPQPPIDPPAPPVEPAQQQILTAADEARVRLAAFRITASFEGGYGSLNTIDRGIVSFGWLQFTLAAGSLISVLQNYLSNAESDVANRLRSFLPAITNRDPNLRNNRTFLDLLRQTADEPEMVAAQDAAAQTFWNTIVAGYIRQRRLKLPLSWALLFDMGINFGPNHALVRIAEDELGVPRRSRPGENGVTEQQLITKVAEIRKRSHDRQAQEENLPGLARRGDFWMNLVLAGDWGLQGDANGNLSVFGRQVQVRNP